MNYKLKVRKSQDQQEMLSDQTNIGDLMELLEGDVGHIILHTYASFIDLNDPTSEWSGIASLKVKLLPKGTIIKLKVK